MVIFFFFLIIYAITSYYLHFLYFKFRLCIYLIIKIIEIS